MMSSSSRDPSHMRLGHTSTTSRYLHFLFQDPTGQYSPILRNRGSGCDHGNLGDTSVLITPVSSYTMPMELYHEVGAQVGKVRGGGAPARLPPGVGVGGCRDDREAKRLNAAPGVTGLPVSASWVSWAQCGLPGRGGGGLHRRAPPPDTQDDVSVIPSRAESSRCPRGRGAGCRGPRVLQHKGLAEPASVVLSRRLLRGAKERTYVRKMGNYLPLRQERGLIAKPSSVSLWSYLLSWLRPGFPSPPRPSYTRLGAPGSAMLSLWLQGLAASKEMLLPPHPRPGAPPALQMLLSPPVGSSLGQTVRTSLGEPVPSTPPGDPQPQAPCAQYLTGLQGT